VNKTTYGRIFTKFHGVRSESRYLLAVEIFTPSKNKYSFCTVEEAGAEAVRRRWRLAEGAAEGGEELGKRETKRRRRRRRRIGTPGDIQFVRVLRPL
jgi:hypothetical protein